PPDPANWGYDLGDGSGWGNHELELYTNDPANASMDGAGNLVITARRIDPATAPNCYYGKCLYTSARLLTRDRLEVAHGRIEMRARVAPGVGAWNAFWALGSNINTVGWPTSGEIDVMEALGRQPNRVYGTAHGPGYSGANGDGGILDASDPLSAAFHTYAVEWQANEISWYLDGVKYKSATPKDVTPNKWVYNHPFFLLLNLAVGGDFGGPVSPSTQFPMSMAVDYVRVYSAPDTAQRFSAHFTDKFSGWKQITLPFKSFARSEQQPDGAPQSRLDLKNMWGYSLDVPEGMPQPVYLSKVQTVKFRHSR
ncbi:MAG: family 16 glycosylhydrolase, partial [Chloroflexi bacterium]|nr:family 16 glycosylhydrolase [Chloroflexota bacterium]